MPKVVVRLFAAPREIVGSSTLLLDLPSGSRVGDLLSRIERDYPGISRWRPHLALFLDGKRTSEEEPLKEGCEVALLPPVSGGSLPSSGTTRDPIRIEQALSALDSEGSGAWVIFVGRVRETPRALDPQTRVESIEIESFEPHATEALREIASDAKGKFSLTDTLILHRIGAIPVGETVLLVAASSPHRQEAFEGVRWMVEEVKRTPPLWKKERGGGKSAWVNDPTFPEGSPR